MHINNLYFGEKFRTLLIKILAILVMLFLVPVFCVNASGKVDYSLYCENCDKDRLFTVDVLANGNTDIAAVTLCITFDPNYMEFRSMSGANSAFEVDHSLESGKVSAIILCPYGYKFNGKARLLTYKFKSIKSGTTNIKLSVKDAVNNKCKSVQIGNVYSTTLTINSKGIKSSSSKKNNSSNIKGESIKSKTDEIKSKSDENTDPIPATAENGNSIFEDRFDIIDKNAESIAPYFIAALGGAGFVFLLIVVYCVGKHSGKKRDNDK